MVTDRLESNNLANAHFETVNHIVEISKRLAKHVGVLLWPQAPGVNPRLQLSYGG